MELCWELHNVTNVCTNKNDTMCNKTNRTVRKLSVKCHLSNQEKINQCKVLWLKLTRLIGSQIYPLQTVGHSWNSVCSFKSVKD